MTAQPKKKQVSPAMRRRRNLAAFWQQRYDAAAGDNGELARVSFDRARAAAVRAERDGHQHAMYELAQLLNEWAERAEAKRQAAAGSHAS